MAGSFPPGVGSFLSILIDVSVGVAGVWVLLILLGRIGVEVPAALGWVPGLAVFLYAVLARRGLAPSLGHRVTDMPRRRR